MTPGEARGYVSLLKGMFERAAYGWRLPLLLPVAVKKQLPAPNQTREKAPPPPRSTNLGDVGGLRFGAPATPEPVKAEKPKREKAPKRKHDPKLIAAARELRDRWHVNQGGVTLLASQGKYDVARALPSNSYMPLPAA